MIYFKPEDFVQVLCWKVPENANSNSEAKPEEWWRNALYVSFYNNRHCVQFADGTRLMLHKDMGIRKYND